MKRVGLAVILVLLIPAGASAQERAVAVVDDSFAPAIFGAVQGDRIMWTWTDTTNQHDVVAYAGDSFASPLQTAGSFSATFGGGTVSYRCTRHSGLFDGSCSGMCGTITDDVSAPAPPEFTQPADGATLGSDLVAIAGTASADSARLALSEGSRTLADVVPSNGSWSITRSFPNGEHTVRATAFDASGNPSDPATVSFHVADSTAPPAPVITDPASDSFAGAKSVTLRGTSSVDTAWVRLGETGTTLGSPRPVSGGRWSATVFLSEGPHTIVAYARDGADNESDASDPVAFTVDAQSPSVAITSPQNLSPVTTPVAITGTAADNIAVASVTVTARDQVLGTQHSAVATCTGCLGPSATWTVTIPLERGVWSLSATATDRAGHTRQASSITIVTI